MSKIEVSEKNDWILIVLLVASIIFCFIGLEGCATTRIYPYKVTFADGTVEYFELPYKVKKDSKTIEYNGETILGVDSCEMIK